MKKVETLEEWFENLSIEEQEQYFEEQHAEYWIEEYKNNPEIYY